MRYLVFLALAGCASTQTYWTKPGATERDFAMDLGACRAQAFGVPGALSNVAQVALVQQTCMQGKGWYAVER